jgi:hypothetical protein
MFESKRFIRLRYHNGVRNGIVYGFSPVEEADDRILDYAKDYLAEQHLGAVIEEICIVRMACESIKDDTILKVLELQ